MRGKRGAREGQLEAWSAEDQYVKFTAASLLLLSCCFPSCRYCHKECRQTTSCCRCCYSCCRSHRKFYVVESEKDEFINVVGCAFFSRLGSRNLCVCNPSYNCWLCSHILRGYICQAIQLARQWISVNGTIENVNWNTGIFTRNNTTRLK